MKTRKIVPFGIVSILLLILFIFAVTAPLYMKNLEDWRKYLLIVIGSCSLYSFIKKTISFVIYYNDESLWMKNDLVLFKRNRIQYFTKIAFKDITSACLIETSSASIKDNKFKKNETKIRIYLELSAGQRPYNFYVSLLGRRQLKKLFILIYNKTKPHVLIEKDMKHQ